MTLTTELLRELALLETGAPALVCAVVHAQR
jgi:hypothetical protein